MALGNGRITLNKKGQVKISSSLQAAADAALKGQLAALRVEAVQYAKALYTGGDLSGFKGATRAQRPAGIGSKIGAQAAAGVRGTINGLTLTVTTGVGNVTIGGSRFSTEDAAKWIEGGTRPLDPASFIGMAKKRKQTKNDLVRSANGKLYYAVNSHAPVAQLKKSGNMLIPTKGTPVRTVISKAGSFYLTISPSNDRHKESPEETATLNESLPLYASEAHQAIPMGQYRAGYVGSDMEKFLGVDPQAKLDLDQRQDFRIYSDAGYTQANIARQKFVHALEALKVSAEDVEKARLTQSRNDERKRLGLARVRGGSRAIANANAARSALDKRVALENRNAKSSETTYRKAQAEQADKHGFDRFHVRRAGGADPNQLERDLKATKERHAKLTLGRTIQVRRRLNSTLREFNAYRIEEGLTPRDSLPRYQGFETIKDTLRSPRATKRQKEIEALGTKILSINEKIKALADTRAANGGVLTRQGAKRIQAPDGAVTQMRFLTLSLNNNPDRKPLKIGYAIPAFPVMSYVGKFIDKRVTEIAKMAQGLTKP